MRILLVDDDAIVLEVMQAALESEGHVVSAADGGKQAIALADASLGGGTPFDVVITDISMPRMDGYELARNLKQKDAGLPIIAMSGWGHEVTDEGRENVDFVLTKPPRVAELRTTLKECAALRRS